MTSPEICKKGHDINKVLKFRIWCFDCMQSAMTSEKWLELNATDLKTEYEDHFVRFVDAQIQRKQYQEQLEKTRADAELQRKQYEQKLEQTRADNQSHIEQLRAHVQREFDKYEHQLEKTRADCKTQIAEVRAFGKTQLDKMRVYLHKHFAYDQ